MTSRLDLENPGLADEAWPEDGLERVGRCPLCASSSRSVRHTDLSDRLFRAAPGRWTLHDCAGCGGAYVDPRPTRETIGLAYRSYYTHDDEAPWPSRSSADDDACYARCAI